MYWLMEDILRVKVSHILNGEALQTKELSI